MWFRRYRSCFSYLKVMQLAERYKRTDWRKLSLSGIFYSRLIELILHAYTVTDRVSPSATDARNGNDLAENIILVEQVFTPEHDRDAVISMEDFDISVENTEGIFAGNISRVKKQLTTMIVVYVCRYAAKVRFNSVLRADVKCQWW